MPKGLPKFLEYVVHAFKETFVAIAECRVLPRPTAEIPQPIFNAHRSPESDDVAARQTPQTDVDIILGKLLVPDGIRLVRIRTSLRQIEIGQHGNYAVGAVWSAAIDVSFV